MLVVGQPGSGKSVAMREIAAHCATHSHAPIPIQVALPRLMKQQPERLTIDGIIDGATRDTVSENQRTPLAEYLADELAHGRAIVLCDGLDECGARAPWVAQQLDNILSSLHPGVGFVLATRANAQIPAARLGLPRVELASPEDLSKTVDHVLVACAEVRVPEDDRDAWLATRRAWIEDTKQQHDHLLTVPLLAILLTLICANASDADLPKGRATLLHRAVQQSVNRWEQSRGTLTPTRPWSSTLTAAMLLDGFVVLGRILDGGVTPSRANALQSLSEILKSADRWAMPPAQALEIAEQVLRFWDEHVAVFVVNAADQVTTRSKVFAEIATAMWARTCEHEQLSEWLSEALLYTDSDGAIALSAGLDTRAIGSLLEVGSTGRPEATLMVAELAIHGIVTLSPNQLERTLRQLTAGVVASLGGEPPAKRGPRTPPTKFPTLWDKTRDPGPWPFVQAACLLALPTECRSQRADLVAAAMLDQRSETIAAALSELTDATTDSRPLSASGVAAVNAALAIPVPPKTGMVRESRRRFAILDGERLAPGLAQVALAAASRLDELADDSGEQAFEIAMHATHGVGDNIFAALSRAGIDTSRRWGTFAENMRNWASAHQSYLVALLADLTSLAESSASPSDDGLWSLADVGDLLSATGYPKVAAREFDRAFVHDGTEVRRSWLDAIADAYDIDKSAVASQARYIHQRHQEAGDTRTANDGWFVASATPLVEPSLPDSLDARLTAEQKQTLLSCLEADSDWIALGAVSVLVNTQDAPWDSRELFQKDISQWHRWRAGLLRMVAILTAGKDRNSLLMQATSSDSADYRYAARMTISVDPDLDSDGSITEELRLDADLSVRPKEARTALPAPTHWSCDYCRAVHDVEVEDCSACDKGVRPGV